MTTPTTTIGYAYDVAPSYLRGKWAASYLGECEYDGTVRFVYSYDGRGWQSVQTTGKERDSETNLDYFLARYYSPAMGRFTSPDPLFGSEDDPQSWNMYGYARNNPLLYTDPTGMNYTVCDANGQNCRDLTDAQYNDYLSSIQGSNVSVTPSGTINVQNDNGSVTKVGTATYYDEKKRASDIEGARFLYHQTGPVVKTLAGVSLTFVAVAGGVAAGGAAMSTPFPEAAAFIPRSVMTFTSKQAARAAIPAMGLTGPQAQEALRTIGRATASSTIQVVRAGQQVIVSITRMGRDGYQQVEKFIDQSGAVRVVQKGVNAAGDITHYDIKK